MKLSVVNTFLFFLVLSSSPFNISSKTATPHHKQTLIKAMIHELCKPTINPDLCKDILKKYNGNPLSSVHLLDLVSNLQIQAAQAKKNVLSLKNQSVNPNQPKFSATCGDEYAHAMTQLTDARKSLSHGKIGDAKKFVLKATGNVNSCDVEHAKAKRDKSTFWEG